MCTGDWILVAFPGKKTIKHFVGNVVNVYEEEKEVQVRFLRYDVETSKFHWPQKDDECLIELKDVKGKLSEPNFDHRLKYSFNFDFKGIILG